MNIERLAGKVEPLMPERVRRWRQARLMADPEMRMLLDTRLIAMAYRKLAGINPARLLSLPPEHLARGKLNLGTILYDRPLWEMGLRESELLQNLSIFGRSGAGKTNGLFHLLIQLMHLRIPFLLLDWKRTGRHLLSIAPRPLHVYTPGRSLAPLAFNPFSAPPGLEQHIHVGFVVDAMAHAFNLGEAARHVVRKALLACAEENIRAPSASDILAKLKNLADTGRVRAWKQTAIRAIESIELSGLSSANHVDRLLHQHSIVELDSLSDSAKRFLIPMLALWLYYARLAEPDREQLRFVLIVEEAHHVFHRGDGNAHETVMEMLLRQCREIGISMVIVDQHPGLISSAVLGNTYATICLNLKDPRDITKAASILSLDTEEQHLLQDLPAGQGVVRLQDRWTKPVHLRFPLVEFRKGAVTDAALLAKQLGGPAVTTESLHEKARVGQIPPLPAPEGLESSPGHALLMDVLTHPDTGVRDRYDRLGLAAGTGDRLKRRLLASGWLESATVPSGNTRKVILRLTAKARSALGVEDGVLRESIPHAYWKRWYAVELARQGWKTTIEAPIPGGAVDVLAEKDGRRLAVEIETGKSDVVSNVKKALAAGIETVWVVATDPAIRKRIVNLLMKQDMLSLRRIRIASPGGRSALPFVG